MFGTGSVSQGTKRMEHWSSVPAFTLAATIFEVSQAPSKTGSITHSPASRKHRA
ncbi:hypothetical protein LILAB_18360 [Corallococcus macrosporus]|uniref:Uncharacterized protein n=1 Tax=Myxococcus fulvus (strain ATCC BAA-855 / HW-1) TaxID=483219 RepID=F8C6I5_MYXFH|nr:hypothetical protein LILAB_18360 [Corallococcus macrosporus]